MLKDITFVAVEQGSAPRYRVSGFYEDENRQVLLTLDESSALRIMNTEERQTLAERKLLSEEELNELKASTLGSYIKKAAKEHAKANAAVDKYAHSDTNKRTLSSIKKFEKNAETEHNRRIGIKTAAKKNVSGEYQNEEVEFNEGVEDSINPLSALLKSAFASEYAFYLKAHFAHWNVEGPDFSEFHELFGKIYEEVFDVLDDFAENIRKCGDYAPGSFESFLKLSKINSFTDVKSATEFTSELLSDSDKLATIFGMVYKIAEAHGEFGLANFLADRQDAQRKHSWMLKSTLKSAGFVGPVLAKEEVKVAANPMKFKTYIKQNNNEE